MLWYKNVSWHEITVCSVFIMTFWRNTLLYRKMVVYNAKIPSRQEDHKDKSKRVRIGMKDDTKILESLTHASHYNHWSSDRHDRKNFLWCRNRCNMSAVFCIFLQCSVSCKCSFWCNRFTKLSSWIIRLGMIAISRYIVLLVMKHMKLWCVRHIFL